MKSMQEENMGKVPFSKFFTVGFIASMGAVIALLVYLMANGLNYGIDFSGGTEIQVQFSKPVELNELRNYLEKASVEKPMVQAFDEQNEYLIRFQNPVAASDKEAAKLLTSQIKEVSEGIVANFSDIEPSIRRVDSVGPSIGEELKRKGLLAAFYSLILILVYIALRFDFKYAPGAVLALFHDAIFALGVLTILNKEINVQTVAAVLTIIGYSLNDTIINFDRIRENIPLYKGQSLSDIINRSVNDVLSRTVLTSLTTLMAVVAIYIFAGGVLEDFALTLIVGIGIGTISSVFIACPMLVWMDRIPKWK